MQLSTFLMFSGRAEEAMDAYVSLIPNSRVVSVERFAANGPGPEGTLKQAVFELNGVRMMCIDSAVQHQFTFTPSMSLFLDCDDESQLDELYAALVRDGKTLMPPDEYGFSRKFAWLQDRFGVSWQLNLP